MSFLSQAPPLGSVSLPHGAFQEHAAHIIEWSMMLSSKGSMGTCIPKVLPHSSLPLHGAPSGRCWPSPSGRSAARATVGGEFPTCTLSVVPRVPRSPLVHVSARPPLLPDSRLSRVRLAASDVVVLSPHSLPLLAEAYAHTRLHPSPAWFPLPRARSSVYHILSSTASRMVSPLWPSLYRESLRLCGE